MKVVKTSLEGCVIIEPKIFGDHRGFFKETFQAERYKEIGLDLPFVQDNHSRSTRGVLRGLHFQRIECIRSRNDHLGNPAGNLVGFIG